jgi:hypothetical protein
MFHQLKTTRLAAFPIEGSNSAHTPKQCHPEWGRFSALSSLKGKDLHLIDLERQPN